MNTHTYTNELIKEKSPYLLQHAHNPVNWYPWGNRPFQIAKEKNIPVLISIGYATCHWCHVMEKESFEDAVLAAVLNDSFVCIKVDREERPDVDSIYMQAIQALGQQGGWPLNVFLTPDGLPFYGGTYFPPERRHNLPSFLDVLKFLIKTWDNEQEKITKQTQAIIDYIRQSSTRKKINNSLDDLSFDGEEKAQELFENHYDKLNHGFQFQSNNKFPPSMGLSLLLRHHHRTGNVNSLIITENTLKAMKFGGVYDQIGGGLSRYSTDYRWLVPHFEKMLYDNALFANALIEAYQVNNKQEFADFANDLLQYIDRDMTSEDGTFFSAEDADSEGIEGKFYVWSKKEIEKVLGRKTSSVAIPFYNITQSGNFEGANILHVTRNSETVAKEIGMNHTVFLNELQSARKKLLEARNRRIRPLLDDKVLTSWNSLMISAMAKTGRVLEDAGRIEKAAKAMQSLLEKLRTVEGKMLRRFRKGEAKYNGYLFDHSATAVACLDLYEATYEPHYIQIAKELMQIVVDQFSSDSGAFYETATDSEELLIRQISGYDGVEPSGNSNAAMAFLKLSAYLVKPELTQKAENIFLSFNDELMEYGLNSTYMLQALHLYLGGLKEVVIVGKKNDAATQSILKSVRKGFFPNAVFAFSYEEDIDNNAKIIPLFKDRRLKNGRVTVYVCHLGACLPPVQTLEELVKLLSYE